MSFRSPQTIIPRLSGEYVNGRWKAGGEGEPFTIKASVQPATTSDYDQMRAEPSGRSTERMVRIYTDAELNVAGTDDTGGDTLLLEGSRYLVVAVSPWRSTRLKHYRFLATRMSAL